MVDLSGGPDGPIEHGFSNSVFIIPGAIIFGLSGKLPAMIGNMESLDYPRAEEFLSESEYEFMFKEAKDLPTERILRILSGKEVSYIDHRDLTEVLLRRGVKFDSIQHVDFITLKSVLLFIILLFPIVFFGWKLYISLKDREKRREEKKKLKQKKKK